MSKHRKRRGSRSGSKVEDVPMTPMIDVVFQLLIYFVVTFEVPDAFAHMQVYRPAPDRKSSSEPNDIKSVRIGVYDSGFTINDRNVSLETLEEWLYRLADLDRSQTIIIVVASNSKHKRLIQVLDLCALTELKHLSVISTD